MSAFQRASREYKQEGTNIQIGKVTVGGGNKLIIAGPCAVENSEIMHRLVPALKDMGVHVIRGGAFKPRTSPYSFQGLGEEGLRILKETGQSVGLPVVTELMDVRDAELVYEYTDMIQIGSRNMQNFTLLREVGKMDKPVMLKRGLSATIEEWLLAAEYILAEGNHQVILCERGIRTFESYTRNTLDVVAVAVAKNLSHLPVIVDPSHATGRRELVIPAAKAAMAIGADGVMVEVHPNPAEALSDGQQSLTIEEFSLLIKEISKMAQL
ncbi:MAG: 3-deoxy-7-phosphoheptulonate synthase [Firmicutes bacterium]|nr:3-deoxy-7-phosphoheptulonate synthase [Bacillota bacterium]